MPTRFYIGGIYDMHLVAIMERNRESWEIMTGEFNENDGIWFDEEEGKAYATLVHSTFEHRRTISYLMQREGWYYEDTFDSTKTITHSRDFTTINKFKEKHQNMFVDYRMLNGAGNYKYYVFYTYISKGFSHRSEAINDLKCIQKNAVDAPVIVSLVPEFSELARRRY